MKHMIPSIHGRSLLLLALFWISALSPTLGKETNSSTLSELELAKRDAEDFEKLAKLVKPSVVVIESVDRLGREGGRGTGFVVRKDGVIATNTTLSREGATAAEKAETGGLSGALLTERAEDFVRRIRQRAGDDLPIVGVGGIMTAEHAVRRVDAGANLIQVYTGLVYGGPGVIREMVEALA